jgi:hypothetical protein
MALFFGAWHSHSINRTDLLNESFLLALRLVPHAKVMASTSDAAFFRHANTLERYQAFRGFPQAGIWQEGEADDLDWIGVAKYNILR